MDATDALDMNDELWGWTALAKNDLRLLLRLVMQLRLRPLPHQFLDGSPRYLLNCCDSRRTNGTKRQGK